MSGYYYRKMIYIHIGQEKTGSTAIQSFLNRAEISSELRKHDIHYASFLDKPNSMPFVLYTLGMTNMNLSKPYFKDKKGYLLFEKKIERRLNSIKNITSSSSKIIFSSEHLHAQLRSEEQVKKLKHVIIKYFPDHCIKIVMYIREQASLAYSLHSESVKAGYSGASKPPMPGENKYFDHVSNHLRTINLWSKIFGEKNLNIRIYEKNSLIEQDSISDFCIQAGINKEEIPYQGFIEGLRSNKLTLSGQALKIKSMINISTKGTIIPYNNLLNEALVQIFGQIKEAKDPKLFQAITETYLEGNEEIKQRLFINRDQLFQPYNPSEDASEPGIVIENIKQDKIIELIILLLRKIHHRNSKKDNTNSNKNQTKNSN